MSRPTPPLAQILPDEILVELKSRGISVLVLDYTLRAEGWDGCSWVPDIYTPACQLHDALYMAKITSRAEADALFRMTIVALARQDEWLWRQTGRGVAWLFWAGVRVFGRQYGWG